MTGIKLLPLLQDGPCKVPENWCDFETDGLCGYTYDLTADFQWYRRQGPTPSADTGPAVGDHTTGTEFGYYMATGSVAINIMNVKKCEKIKSKNYYAEACNEWRGPSPRFSKRCCSGGEPLAALHPL